MQQFPSSARVHEMACRVLASTYASASKEEMITKENQAVEDLETIAISMSAHIHNTANTAAACYALHGLSALLSGNSLDLNNLFQSVIMVVVNVIQLYREDQQILETATGALCAMRDGLAVSFESDNAIVGVIIAAMNRFSKSIPLRSHCMGILLAFFSLSEKGARVLTYDLIAALERSIGETDEEEECDAAINIILTLSRKGCQAENSLLRNQSMIGSIVAAQFMWPESPRIQGAAASIFSNIALNNPTRADICQMGGTSRVISALNRLNQDPLFTCRAFQALANLFSGADAMILRSPDAPAASVLVRAMTTHPENISVQIKGAHALWLLSSKGDAFNDEIVKLGGAEVLSEAISRFQGSEQMLADASIAIWSLAGASKTFQDDARKKKVGQCTIESVVGGMRTLITQEIISQEGILSEKAYEQALGCLKCLSAVPENKELLRENGALDLIYSCMLQHYGNPTVCKEALGVICNMNVRNTNTNEVTEMRAMQLEAVALVMESHQADPAVQKNAIFLLRNASFSPTNIVLIKQNPVLPALVRSARSNFGGEHRRKADELLEALSQSTNGGINILEDRLTGSSGAHSTIPRAAHYYNSY